MSLKHIFMTSRYELSHACLITSQGICNALHLYSACRLPFSTFGLLTKKSACLLGLGVNSCDHLCGHFAAAFACVWRECVCVQARACKHKYYNISAALQLGSQVVY